MIEFTMENFGVIADIAIIGWTLFMGAYMVNLHNRIKYYRSMYVKEKLAHSKTHLIQYAKATEDKCKHCLGRPLNDLIEYKCEEILTLPQLKKRGMVSETLHREEKKDE